MMEHVSRRSFLTGMATLGGGLLVTPAKFFHQHSLDHKAYGFCYDDVGEQAAFFRGKGQNLIVTLY